MSAFSRSKASGSGVALSLLETRDRATIMINAVLGATERGVLVLAAVALAADDRRQGLALGAVLAALYAARSVLRGSLRARLQRRLHRRAADAVLGGDPLVATPLGDDDAEVVLLDGVHHGSILLAERLPALAGDAFASVFILVYLTAVLPARVLALGAAGLAFAATAAVVARGTTARAQDASWAAYRPLLDRMLFAIRGRMELVANGAAAEFGVQLDEHLDAFERTTLRADRLAAVASRAPLVAGGFGVLLAFLAQGRTDLGAGTALAEAALFASVVPAFVGLAQNAHESWRLDLLFRPMAALLSIPRATTGGTQSPPAARAPIVLHDVTYRYPGAAKDAVSNVSLELNVGDLLVLSGANGSGKSTVLRLLAALGSPSQGTIVTGGVELSSLDPAAWRSKVTYLPQQPQLPETFSVAAALRLLAPKATDAALKASLERVEVWGALVDRVPSDPLAVKIAELSTGQRKRVALARVLLDDASELVLLDEPDASLDAEGVQMVERVARELATTRLVAVAAHTPGLVGAPGVHVELAAA